MNKGTVQTCWNLAKAAHTWEAEAGRLVASLGYRAKASLKLKRKKKDTIN